MAVLRSCALIAAVVPLALAAQQRPPQIGDIMRLRSVVEIDLSDDGEFVATITAYPDSARDVQVRELSVRRADGRGGPTLLAAGERIANPRWNPAKRQLAYIAPVNGIAQLMVWSPTSGTRQVGTSPFGLVSLAWAPDGDRIATIELDSLPRASTIQRLPDPVRQRQIHLVDMRDGVRRLITAVKRVYDDLDWSPDGFRLVVSHRTDASTRAFVLGMDLSLVDVRDGAMTSLVTRPGMDGGPKWSPDGRYIAFITHDGDTNWIASTHLAVIAATGDRPPQIVSRGVSPERIFVGESAIEWRSDSKAVLWPMPSHQRSVVMEFPLDSTAMVRELRLLDGTVGDVVVARRANRMAFLGSTPRSAWEAYSGDDQGHVQRLSWSNPLLDSLVMPTLEDVSWRAPDGTQIEGVLLRPTRTDGRLPLIAYLHGGPAWLFTSSLAPQGWIPKSVQGELYPLLALASSGIAVLMPNPRGSLGRGESFRLSVVRQLGRLDAGDVLAGVDSLIASGIADSTRLGVMGYSYGGTLTASLLTRSSRFKGAQVGAGMVDPVAAWSEMDIPELVAAYAGGPPWANPAEYLATSVWSRIENYGTATMIQTGDADRRIPPSQARALYRALQARGVRSELILYRGEGHGLVRPSHQRHFMEQVQSWFVEHLVKQRH